MSANLEYEIDEVRMPRMFANMRKAGMYRRCACAGCGPCRGQAQSLLRRVSKYGRSLGSLNSQRWGDRFQISSARVGNRLMNVMTDFGGVRPRIVDAVFGQWNTTGRNWLPPRPRPPLNHWPLPPIVIGRPPYPGTSAPPLQTPAPTQAPLGNSDGGSSGTGHAAIPDERNDDDRLDTPALDDLPLPNPSADSSYDSNDGSSVEDEATIEQVLPNVSKQVTFDGPVPRFSLARTSRGIGAFPETPGVYVLRFGSAAGQARNFSYIGATNNLRRRIQEHLAHISRYYKASPAWVVPFIHFTSSANERDAFGLEDNILKPIRLHIGGNAGNRREGYRKLGLLNQKELMFEYV